MIKRTIILSSLLCLALLPACTESRFELTLTEDAVLSAASLGVFGASLIVPENRDFQQDRNEINPFDALWVAPYSDALSTAGTISACTALILPAIPAGGHSGDITSLVTYSAMYFQAFFLTTGIKDLIKAGVSRWRPYTYENSFLPEEASDRDYRNSFPSGHTAYAFLGATFFAATFSHDYPESPWTTALTAAAYSAAGITGILRVTSGEHFISDVVTGAAIGAFCGWLIPSLHRSAGSGTPLSLTANSRILAVSINL